MIARDKEMILRSLDREHGFLQRQSLLRQIWRLDEVESHEPISETDPMRERPKS